MVNFMCVLSALLFMAGNALLITYYVREFNRPHFDYDTYVSLDPDMIQQEWDFRIEHRPKYLAAGILNALAWFFFMFPIIQLAWILSQGGSKWISLHICIELLVTQFNLDSWITTDDQIGWRSLEVTHIVTYGLVTFIDAFEWILLFVIFTLIHISVKRWRRQVDSTTFGACWNALGLFVALFSLLDFVAEILRIIGFSTFGKIAFWYSSVNRLLLLPGWLLLLGCRLPVAGVKLNQYNAQARQGPPSASMQNGESEGAMVN
ncbi:MAG: hypothetical protein SGARI_005598 [Bacillariaceae sp.]